MVKLKLPRKMVLVISGVVVLGGASGAAALFIGRDVILGPSTEELSGVECKDIVRVAEMRKGRGPWLRKFVKVPPGTDGITRAKTALRVATKIQETLPADLIEIAVLDENGPDKRAHMRGRAVGAEVILAKDPALIPGIDAKYTVNYYEGGASGTGMFYGKAETMSSKKAEALVSKMDELTDCTPPPGKENASVGGGHESKSEGHAAKTEGHGESGKAADGHGDSGHGEATAAEAGKSEGIVSKMLGMVGLGGGDDAAPNDAGQSEGHAGGHEQGSSAHGDVADGHGGAAPSTTQSEPVATDPATNKSLMFKMLGMIGLGGDGKPKTTIENSGGPSIVNGSVQLANPHSPAVGGEHATDSVASEPAPSGHNAH